MVYNPPTTVLNFRQMLLTDFFMYLCEFDVIMILLLLLLFFFNLSCFNLLVQVDVKQIQTVLGELLIAAFSSYY